MNIERFQSSLLSLTSLMPRLAFVIFVDLSMLVLVYCLSIFELDRKKRAINLAIFSPGQFATQARVAVNSVYTAVVVISLDSIRVQALFSFFTHVGTSVALCFPFTVLVHRLEQPQSRPATAVYSYRSPVAITVYVAKSVSCVERQYRNLGNHSDAIEVTAEDRGFERNQDRTE